MAQSSGCGGIRVNGLVIGEVEFRHQNLVLVTVSRDPRNIGENFDRLEKNSHPET